MSGRPTPSRIALHESAHAVVAWSLGYEDPGPITVVPADGLFGGLCVVGRSPAPHSRADAVYPYTTPLPMAPPKVRRYVESDVMISLAGDTAEDLFDWTGQTLHSSSDAVLTDLDRVALASPRDRRLLARERARVEPGASDADQALTLLLATHLRDLELALAHRRLLELETRRILRLNAQQLVALALLLDEHGTLSGDRWHRHLNDAAQRRAGVA